MKRVLKVQYALDKVLDEIQLEISDCLANRCTSTQTEKELMRIADISIAFRDELDAFRKRANEINE